MNKLPQIALLLLSTVAVEAADKVQWVQESKQSIHHFSKQLKHKLQQGMKAGGAVNAINICHSEAEAISAQVSAQFGWKIARTALKFRNSHNRPDRWEENVLQQFERRLKAGEPIEQLEFSEMIAADKTTTFRYMKAIPTQGLCLSCHGENLAPAVAKKLQKIYPQDQATGFSIGDIRGAFTITRTMN